MPASDGLALRGFMLSPILVGYCYHDNMKMWPRDSYLRGAWVGLEGGEASDRDGKDMSAANKKDPACGRTGSKLFIDRSWMILRRCGGTTLRLWR
jgi:hypothetical protein